MFGSLIASIFGAKQQAKATKSAEAISREALAQQKAQQDKVWGAVDPYMKTGGAALERMADPNAFLKSAGYDFRLNQGLEAVAQSKAVNGLLRSGGAMKAISDYGQETASDERARWFAEQQALAGLGVSGAGIGAGVANATSAAIGQDATNRANAGLTRANAWSGLAGQIGATADRAASMYFGG